MQGWRWYYPDAGGEIAPDKRENLCLPDGPEVFHPSLPFARSFDMSEGYVYTSSAFLMWMIRNRMSVAIAKEPTRALARKLGFISKYGGHIFEQMLAPDKPWGSLRFPSRMVRPSGKWKARQGKSYVCPALRCP